MLDGDNLLGQGAQALIPIPMELHPYLSAAAVRVGYLHPNFTIELSPEGFRVSGPQAVRQLGLKRDLLHAVYREKIYHETLALRQGLLDLLKSR